MKKNSDETSIHEKPISLAKLGDRTGEIGRNLRAIGWLMTTTDDAHCFSNKADNPFLDLGVMISKLGKELIELESVPLVDCDGNSVK